MQRFMSHRYQAFFEHHDLTDFDAFWSLSLTPVDVPNLERGGHSEVARITLEATGRTPRTFFVKRQTNHIGRSLQRPFGEPTFAREARNIETFQRLGIPALESAYYEERKRSGQWQAILVTPALEGYTDMVERHAQWHATDEATRKATVEACAGLLRQLHERRWRHGSLYAKHVFLRSDDTAPGGFDARFIDLEKSRPLINARREKRRDLAIFARRLTAWRPDEWQRFLSHYLNRPAHSLTVRNLQQALHLAGD
ncbi:lipopolysaccharide kinase InaA family protein [Salinicola peritrichatus]|uniref:lipopolysaccharide kinase InaA family protein n=1 Tax=Salinicola peritrichatus TaxID=1267424 RepID=UPI0013A6104B|nr:lipopolysaccharide kinase InaA family protein [Salinicola peritrichatus]